MSDYNQNIFPFGKHKGKSIEEVQTFDPRYLDWLTGQDWFRNKFVVLHQTIINRGAEPEETPDHNALQTLFLDDAFCLRFVAAAGCDLEGEFSGTKKSRIALYENLIRECRKELEKSGDFWRTTNERKLAEREQELKTAQAAKFNPKIEKRGFEVRGVDVTFEVVNQYIFQRMLVEIKPCVGDDYPAVLRQIKRLVPDRSWGTSTLFLERYTGTGATLGQFTAIFKSANIAVVFRHQVEP